MIIARPVDLNTAVPRSEVSRIYGRVAAAAGGECHFHRGPAYVAEFLPALLSAGRLFLLVTVLTAGATAAEEDSVSVEAGIRVGANITGWFENPGGRGNTTDESGPLVIGPMIGIRFLRLFGIEAAALYTGADRKSSWAYGSLARSQSQESGSVWEFPALGKVRVPIRFAGLRPFVVAGPVWHRLRTTERSSGGYYGQRPDGQLGWIESSGTNKLRESGLGWAVGGGVERLAGRARLSLEGRFSRWPAPYTSSEVRRRQSSQFAVFAGFGF